jgi:peptide/nickel transport system permease protein
MIAFIVRRVLLGMFTTVVISVVAFAIIIAPPGDFAERYGSQLAGRMGVPAGTPQYQQIIDGLRVQFGLNEPVPMQYLDWAWGLLRGDMGLSQELMKPVREIIGERLLMTVILAGTTILFTWAMAIPIGIYAAVRQHSPGDYALTFVGFLGLAVPDFLLGLTLLWIVFDKFDVLLDGLFDGKYVTASWSLGRVWNLLKHLWIPALVLGTSGTAGLIRIMRNNLLDELRKPYVVTARAKGMPEWKLVLKYPVRVALNPLISGVGYILPALFSGSVIVSVVLNLPTLGPILLRSLLNEDLYMASTVFLMLGVMTVVGMLLSDLLLAFADPRVKIENV